MSITVDVDPAFSGFDHSIIQDIIKTVFKSDGYNADNIAMIFGDDELLNGLKKEYFDQDHLTDVIAFRLNDYSDKNVEGEIYISIPRAKENAEAFNEPFAKEISRLIIHGSLHLLNYDDQTVTDKMKMTKKENDILIKCNWVKLISE